MELIKTFNKILVHPLNSNHRIKTFFRIIFWKINQLTFRRIATVEIVPGVFCLCYPKSSFGSLIVYTRLPEYWEMVFVQQILSDSDIFVDVGAGLGDYSLIAASKIKTGKIFAFEPDPVAFAYFEENIKLNAFQNRISASAKIVSDRNGYEKFTSTKISELSHISAEEDIVENQLKIPSITLDTFLINSKNRKIRLIKIDVEGAELKVLYGLRNLLEKKAIDYMIIEVNYRNALYNGSANKVFSFLKANNFTIYVFDDLLKLTPLNKSNLDKSVFNILAAYKTKRNINEIEDYILT